MSEGIVRLQGSDFEDAMDFLNLVFGTHAPHDFERLLPAIYKPTDEEMAHNHAVRKNGKIRGIVGLFPIRWQVGEAVLRVGGIGGVSTHPKSRGDGYMKALMRDCVDQMKAESYHLSYLGGQRQRYQYFGYERAGCVSHFSLNRSNLRHCFADEPGIRFERLEEGDERVGKSMALHDGQYAHCLRQPDNFYNHLRNWHNQPFAALDAAGEMVGYLVANEKGDSISELVAIDDETALLAMRAWAGEQGEASIALSAARAGLARLLGTYCESTGVRSSGNWRIFAWEEVLDALMKMRGQGGRMVDGCVVVDIEGYGGVELKVEGGAGSCARSDGEPAVRCDGLTATRLLCGPLSPSTVMALPERAAVLEQWCPLPLHWPGQDGV